jgi:hypothetical protein
MARFRTWLLALLAASPALVPLFLVLRYGVDVPHEDEWSPDLASIYVKAHQHQLGLSDLFAQHNECRIVIPRLIYLGLNSATRLYVIDELLVGLGIVCVTSLCILWLIYKSAGPCGAGARRFNGRILVPWFLCNLLLFSPTQYENWLDGSGIIDVLPALFVVLSLAAASAEIRPLWKVGICILTALCATYSFGNGILCWPLLVLYFAGSWTPAQFRARLWMLILGTGIFVAALAPYFVHFTSSSGTAVPGSSGDPRMIILYNLIFIGGPLAAGSPYPIAVGAAIGSILLAMLGAAVVYWFVARRGDRRELADRMALWLVVGCFGFLSGLIASFFRAGWGIKEALSPRYGAFASYVPLALIPLAPMICADLRARRALGISRAWSQGPLFMGVALVGLHLMCFSPDLEIYRNLRISRREGKAAVMLVKVLPNNPQIPQYVCDSPDFVRDQAGALSAMGYLRPPLVESDNAELIRESDPDADDRFSGQMDRVSQGADGSVKMLGWAFCPFNRQCADAVFLTYENEQHQPIIFAAAYICVNRADLVDKLGSDAEWSGWYAAFSESALPSQLKETRISAWAVNADTGKAVQLDGVLTLNLSHRDK